MKFKDVNCGYYFSRRSGQYAGTWEEVGDICRKNNIVSRAVQNFDFVSASVHEANQDVLSRCSESGDIPVIRLLPPAFSFESYTKEEMINLINRRAVFKINPEQDASPVTCWMFDWMLNLLEESSTPVLISLQEADLGDLAEVKSLYPNLKIIITNTTQWMNRQYIRFVLSFSNVFIDTSNIIEYYGIESVAEIIGADRMLFGTYMPEKEPYDKIFQMLYNDLSQEQRELIAFGNFERIIERVK
jgi:predicted TIM-barrel fold metal-dependent hydrolase